MVYDRGDKMDENLKKKSNFGQQMTAKWLAFVPRSLRYLLIFSGLLLLIYLVNKGIWF